MLDGNHDRSASLLIVDDEPAIRSLISQVLIGIGYHVRSAEDGVSALAEIRDQMPDIILSDLNMPGMSGFELISVVRQSYPSIQVIAMSGAFSGEEVPSGVAADAFYQKGCGPGSLLKIIRALPRLDRISNKRTAAPVPAWN
jgi:CheY-like chemotaxis protein